MLRPRHANLSPTHDALRFAGAALVVACLASCGEEPTEPAASTEAALVASERDATCHAAATPSGCALRSFGGHDYLRCEPARRESLTPAQAAARCVAWGGRLVAIGDAAENSFVRTFADAGSERDYVIGAELYGDVWAWPDATEFYDRASRAPIGGAYQAWAGGAPPRTGDAVAARIRDGAWHAITTRATRDGWLCESAAPACAATETSCGNVYDDDGNGRVDCRDAVCTSGSDAGASGPGACEVAVETRCGDAHDNDGDGAPDCEDSDCSGTAACPDRCPAATPASCTEVRTAAGLHYVCGPATWLEARDACSARGHVLASIESAAEQTDVQGIVRTRIGSDPVLLRHGAWLGLGDRASEGDLRIATGAPLGSFRRWASGEPRATTPDMDCAVMASDGTWAMRSCTLRLPFVCEPRIPPCTTPAITSQPASQTLTEGGSTSFAVVATGGALRYQWQRNGTDVAGATSPSYAIGPVSLADDGARFRVVVRNDVGTVTSADAILTVLPYPPVIRTQPTDASVFEGTGASFSVAATGVGLSYQWQRGGVDLPGATSDHIDLGAVSLVDEGAVFRVVVSNRGGSVTSAPATLHVRALPRVTTQPADQSVIEDAPATFSVIAGGEAPLRYQWSRDGAAIAGATGPSYTLDTTTLGDDGARFQVTVTNDGGSASSIVATLHVTRTAPVVVAPLHDVSASEGGSASFEIVASGHGLRYAWARDGAPIAGATGPVLELPAIVIDDDGARFAVTVSNEGGSVVSEAVLHVVPNAPAISSDPADATVVEGESATFSVTAVGSRLSYRWERDGASIPGATSATLTLPRATIDDDGATFRAIVSNVSGSVTSRAATLTITPLPPRIVRDPAAVTVPEGGDATFACEAAGSRLAYAWTRDGATIAGETGTTLTMRAVQLDDDGAQIACVVSNASGTVTSASARLGVSLVAPRITSQPADATAMEGTPASFSVGAAGSRVRYQWSRDGVPIAGATEATYAIASVAWADRGARFTVEVANDSGSVISDAATLTVTLAPPRIARAPGDASVREGEPASFHVEAVGTELAYQWSRDGAPIASATTDTLAIDRAAIDDDGATFTVEVSNGAGSVTSTPAVLHVALVAPRIALEPADVSVREGEPAEFVASVEGSRTSLQWERDGAPIPGATSAAYRIDATSVGDDGARFRLVARNAAGEALSREAVLHVAMLPPRIVTGPSPALVDEGGRATFSVVASGTALSYQWQRDGLDVPGATLASYAIDPVLWSDRDATFRVIVSNDAGSVTSDPALLSVVLGPPSIVSGPESQTARETETATFRVDARGSELAYEWEVDGAIVAGAAGPTLTLGPLTTADDGAQIRVRVWNAAGEVTSGYATLTVERVSPVIVADPASIAVFEGESATFTVDAIRGESFQWRRDGAEIAGATAASYALPFVSIGDDGARFDVVVSNAAGTVTSAPAILTVRVLPPRITTEPEDVTVTEHGDASFRVVATGTGARFQWRRDGIEIAGATSDTYALPGVELADDGSVFDVIVENVAGRVTSRAAMLHVALAAPTIASSPASLTLIEGGAASFRVAARGSLLRYQWQRDGVDVAGATEDELAVPSVALADDGARFRCVVTNDAGSATSDEATLHVTLAVPSIETAPLDTTVDEGAPASFRVVARGSLLSYQWRRDGAEVGGATGDTLEIASASMADDGARYDVVVTNGAGSVTSAAALLHVRRRPPRIVEAPAATTVVEGEDATFHVVAEGSGLTYAWERDGDPIAGATGDTLVLPVVALGDDGAMVRVVVSNGAGTAASDPVRLTVRPLPPRIVSSPASATVLEGERAELRVDAVGSGLAYQWRRDGAGVAGATSPVYAIDAATLADDGARFDVVVTNASGSVTSDAATLTVRVAPPRIVSSPSSLTIEEGGDASFSCEAEGSRLAYQWQQNGSDVAGATAATYAITGASPDLDGATYRCVVSNEGGSVTSAAATLTVNLALPRITTDPVDQTVDEGSAAVFRVVAIGSRLSYQWQHDGADVAGATGETLTIAHAALADEGEYRVVVRNSAGPVTSAPARLSLRIQPPVITTQPATQIVHAGDAVTFRVVATGTSLTYQWMKNGYAIAGATSAEHAIASVTRDDAGAYQVEVRNPGGVATSIEAVLTVRSAVPVITAQPEDVTAAVGGSATLRVTATGDSLAYQWQRFGADVAGATGPTHTFTVAEGDDGAPFHVIVRNDGGEIVSRDAVVHIRDGSAPTLTVSGATDRSTTEAYVTIEGTATDDRSAPTVRVTSDRFAGETFAATASSTGLFTIEVPIAVGDNVLSVVARDAAGNESSARTVRVHRDLPVLPRVTVTSPVSGTVTADAETTVTGTVLTSLSADAIRLSLGDLRAFPTGTGGTYSFRFDRVPLDYGQNILTVVAETSLGTVSGQTTVIRATSGGDGGPGGGTGTAGDPVISMPGIHADEYVVSDPIAVSGTVTAARCVAQVTLNGTPARLTGSGTTASFDGTIGFGGASSVLVSVVATDCDGRVSSAQFTAHLDTDAPAISLDGLDEPPAENPFVESPAHVTGTIRDASLAGVAVGGVTLGLLPGGEPGLWTFSADVPLSRGEVRTLRVAAWDRAGHTSEKQYQLRLDASVDLALLAPQSGERVFVTGTSGDVHVQARVSGLASSDSVVAAIDDGAEVVLSRGGVLAEGTIGDVASGASHVLRVRVRSAGGDVLAQASATFELVDNDSIPLAILAQIPANGATDVEPNAFVQIQFNRPVDPERLVVELRETVHGRAYSQDGDGVDLTTMSAVELVAVDHDREPIPGNTVLLPGNETMLFYASRDLHYGGELYLDVLYDGAAVGHAQFRVRSLPTLVHGFVADHAMNPLAGIDVQFPELGITVQTDSDGAWDLGFGWGADRPLPSGLHRAIVNPSLHDPEHGSVETFVLVREGDDNRAGVARIPVLDPVEAFHYARSGDATVLLSRGDLALDLSRAALTFPDGLPEGDLHGEMLGGRDLPYLAAWPLEFGFALQPGGVEVAGEVRVSGNLPTFRGTYDWVAHLGDRMLVLALDPDSLTLVVVGVVRVDHMTNRFEAERAFAPRRLDCIAFGTVAPEGQDVLAAFARGDISLADLRAATDARP